MLYRFAGQEVEISDDAPVPSDTLVSAVDFYRETWSSVDIIAFAGASLEEVCRGFYADPPVNLRWVLFHLLEETARHAGHADILRELIDGQTGR